MSLTIQNRVSFAKLLYWSIVDKTLNMRHTNTTMNLKKKTFRDITVRRNNNPFSLKLQPFPEIEAADNLSNDTTRSVPRLLYHAENIESREYPCTRYTKRSTQRMHHRIGSDWSEMTKEGIKKEEILDIGRNEIIVGNNARSRRTRYEIQ